MSKKKLARAIGVCIIAIAVIVVVTVLSACESSPTPPSYGLDLDGVDDCVALGNATALGFASQDFTIEAWIKPGNVTRSMQILQRHAWNVDGYRLQTENPGKLVFYTFQSGANQVSRTSSDVLVAGSWHHVAVVRQGASVRILVDGLDKTNNAGSHVDPAYSDSRLAA
ncbi:MAG: LamG domain-containing protein, partial [Dehalococcoidia bacterium]|nr:LamG domain-containing protein [Dehalococcoidia bacterium]